MKIVALLTGKGNSALKNKNITKVKGKPILAYPCIEAKKVKAIGGFYTSSDSARIFNIASNWGFKKILRPKKLAKKNSLHRDVILHSLKYLHEKKIFPEIIVVLLANSATIKYQWINKCILKLLKSPKATACVPVMINNDHHPFRAKKINSNGYLGSFFKFKKKISSNRQDLPKNFFLAHNFWVIRTKNVFLNNGEPPWGFLGSKVIPYVIENSIDIHSEQDFKLTLDWLNNKKKF